MPTHNPADLLEGIRERREAVVKRDGSPQFMHTFGTIAATTGAEGFEVHTTFPAARRYEPLDTLILTNNSGADLDLQINGRAHSFIPAGETKRIDDQAIWSIRLINNDGVEATTPLVRANIFRTPHSADKDSRGV